ncbi:hypothetical protein IF1G_01766 [Cordyceps javanica]|uniref:Uncharacterized protein n=1 Tax=Cordyceps javanica TaxID=43265 RepID=A0A545VCU7_9HYPO|nr:hypothetical protein IF1G_01766 [Cordyceps javanica]
MPASKPAATIRWSMCHKYMGLQDKLSTIISEPHPYPGVPRSHRHNGGRHHDSTYHHCMRLFVPLHIGKQLLRKRSASHPVYAYLISKQWDSSVTWEHCAPDEPVYFSFSAFSITFNVAAYVSFLGGYLNLKSTLI